MIDYELFYNWCEDRFGAHNLKVRHTAHGDEICTHSYFHKRKNHEDDHGFHLWMNTTGGKKKLEGGAYRCWKTDEMGSLVTLVSEYDGIPYEEAEEMLGGVTSLRSLEQKVHDFFGYKEEVETSTLDTVAPVLDPVAFPDFTFMIDKMSPSSFWRVRAKKYLAERKIPSTGLYVCTDGDFEYRNRIIIPYYDRDGNLVFWNGRTMSVNPKVQRYAKPKHGDQANVLFMTEWPEPGSKVHVMEGEFDAITLGMADFVGCACGGKFLSDPQINLLRNYEICLAFDADEVGLDALINIGNTLLESGFNKLTYVRPPKAYKDWNKLLQMRNLQTVRAYVEQFEKRFTPDTADLLLSKKVALGL